MVVRAKDLKAGNGEPEEVAIKIIRNNETMWVLILSNAYELVVLASFLLIDLSRSGFDMLITYIWQEQGWSDWGSDFKEVSRCRSRE